ncbi:phosphoglycolate phosphatase [Pseudoalteromonas piscicida]|uniref:phosphoglycolate phosphatase n=1 Tax=Pseudoalteromonas piscicida TaxID=43662 RepID=UPI0030A08B6E
MFTSPAWVGFDLDGTLVSTAEDIAYALNATLQHYNLATIEVGLVKTWIGNGTAKLTERALDFHQNKTVDRSEATRLLECIYDDSVTRSSCLFPNAKTTLEALQKQGIKLALVTNKNTSHTHKLLAHLEIEACFDTIVCADSLARKKPDPLPLFTAVKTLGCEIQDGFYVGDSINDVTTARNAGCKVIAVDYGYNHGDPISQSKPDAIISDLNDVLNLCR